MEHEIVTRDMLIDKLTIERDQLREQRDRMIQQLHKLKSSLQYDLKAWADNNLQPGDDDYKELSELMVENGLDGLKRSFTVSVRVTYEFEVEVDATDEDEARDEVDNNITTHVHENVSLYDTPDDYDLDVSEA